jgi:hypothetical protein
MEAIVHISKLIEFANTRKEVITSNSIGLYVRSSMNCSLEAVRGAVGASFRVQPLSEIGLLLAV